MAMLYWSSLIYDYKEVWHPLSILAVSRAWLLLQSMISADGAASGNGRFVRQPWKHTVH